MARRVLIYALVYGSIGAALGACLAFYTKDAQIPHSILVKNGSMSKATTAAPIVAPSNADVVQSVEPSQVEDN